MYGVESLSGTFISFTFTGNTACSRMPRKKFQRDFFLEKVGKGNQATNAKKDAFNAWKVRVGLYPGNQATNAKKDAFNTWKVRVGLYPG